ncbi:class I SAM-dependent methyltransferase [Burkholderia pseudomultivorans]|uniref:class I SAM-dependent methyltransferase n=1 Tax=Burkholderia pseudomultivorans TaxID=1207504 RepID=UPI00188DE4B9|nr:class I SAM-dependent methyltransferase [Burkholderia pseudomultivorans]MBF5008718.1 class I SAM-dependent methyltransferase [Burkholderia pseudomultivorans]
MGIFGHYVLPRLCDLAMRNAMLAPYRRRVVGGAAGRVLEIGSGSGLNLPLYSEGVRGVFALEPSTELVEMARRHVAQAGPPVDFLMASAERLPLPDESIDTVVSTWTLCSIPDTDRALQEIRRVLAPSGRLLFAEHGLAPEPSVRRWQDWLTPAWCCMSGGCHLNRPIRSLVERAGLRIEQVSTAYAPGLRCFTYFYEGVARKR